MYKLKSVLLTLSLLLSTAYSSGAFQNWALDMNAVCAVPIAHMNKNVNHPAWGVQFSMVGFVDKRAPLAIGGELSFASYGMKRNYFNAPDDSTGDTETYKEVVRDGISRLHAVIRLQPQDESFRPFIDLLGGVMHISTKANVKEVRHFEIDPRLSRNYHNSDWAGSFGVKTGVAFGEALSISLAWMFTTPVTYLGIHEEESIVLSEDLQSSVVVSPYSSTTQVIALMVGVSFAI